MNEARVKQGIRLAGRQGEIRGQAIGIDVAVHAVVATLVPRREVVIVRMACRVVEVQVILAGRHAAETEVALRIGQCRWRPTKHDLANLKASTKDPFAYLTMLRAWRLAGFKVNAICQLANRKLKPRERNSPPPRARTSLAAAQEQLQFTR